MTQGSPFPDQDFDCRDECQNCHAKASELEVHGLTGMKLCSDCFKEWVEADEDEGITEEIIKAEKL